MAISVARKAERIQNLVRAAQDLIRASGDAGFSMAQLAAQAGVSPATPYNLVGAKSDLLRLVIEAEYEAFAAKLAPAAPHTPVAALLHATSLVVKHYEADRQFYRGLYRMIGATEGSESYYLMTVKGEKLWGDMISRAVDAGELYDFVRAGPMTTMVLATIAATTSAWFAQSWSGQRYALEMAHGVRLVVASVAAPHVRAHLVEEIAELQAAIDAARMGAEPA